jgi:hypothetical protein
MKPELSHSSGKKEERKKRRKERWASSFRLTQTGQEPDQPRSNPVTTYPIVSKPPWSLKFHLQPYKQVSRRSRSSAGWPISSWAAWHGSRRPEERNTSFSITLRRCAWSTFQMETKSRCLQLLFRPCRPVTMLSRRSRCRCLRLPFPSDKFCLKLRSVDHHNFPGHQFANTSCRRRQFCVTRWRLETTWRITSGLFPVLARRCEPITRWRSEARLAPSWSRKDSNPRWPCCRKRRIPACFPTYLHLAWCLRVPI